MSIEEIAAQRPRDINEAISCMRKGLNYFHECDDQRAIFLRLYYIMTLEVHAAINQLGVYKRKNIFLDPVWMERLSGQFASLYFQSLTTFEREPSPEIERAWKIAHKVAMEKSSTVVQNAVLGINAHINYDLPYAIFLNIRKHKDSENDLTLQKRKFDHDQVNNLLIRCINPIQDVLARDYGWGIFLLDRAAVQLDEKLAETGLKYYRQRVWLDALSFVSTENDEEEHIVREKINWESYKVAQVLAGPSPWQRILWLPERLLGLPGSLLGKWRFGPIELEKEGGVEAKGTVMSIAPG